MSSIIGARSHVRAKMIRGSSCLMIGPRELATVIGKLETLGLDGGCVNNDPRARINSTIVLLDRETLEFQTLTLTAQSYSKGSTISIFSPLGCALLACLPGHSLTIPGYASGYRFLVSSVKHRE
ncbi:GreA/GreB family elongation factor [Halopseudomonas laoshanensis]|uniref:GreA/GreB family elongation factor n=1 Tax=Halopseudomonas laoshanensis TaxID=2268758 RepID=UPI0011EE0139|nr:GreA/GreB family elongation factor [Halopseudomonas laoshanensis]